MLWHFHFDRTYPEGNNDDDYDYEMDDNDDGEVATHCCASIWSCTQVVTCCAHIFLLVQWGCNTGEVEDDGGDITGDEQATNEETFLGCSQFCCCRDGNEDMDTVVDEGNKVGLFSISSFLSCSLGWQASKDALADKVDDKDIDEKIVDNEEEADDVVVVDPVVAIKSSTTTVIIIGGSWDEAQSLFTTNVTVSLVCRLLFEFLPHL